MNMEEKLKKMLEDGIITQEQYNELIGTDPTGTDIDDGTGDNEPSEEVRKLAQSLADKANASLGKENAKLKKEIDKLKKQNLTAEQLKKIEDEEKEALLAERERNVILAENKLYAIAELKEAGLDDGSKSSLDLIDLVMDEDKEAIKSKIKAVNNIIKARVKAEVEKVFKDNSSVPGKASGASGTVNPYAKETFNLTEQMRLEVENPEYAKQLRALAEVKK